MESKRTGAALRLHRLGGHFTSESDKEILQPTPVAGRVTKNAGPVHVLVTGAAGQIAYSLIPMIATGKMLGPSQQLILHLLDIPPMKAALDGVVMELEDCAFPLVVGNAEQHCVCSWLSKPCFLFNL